MACLRTLQYFILAISVVATFLKYCLLVIDMRHAEPWDARPVYAAYLDLATGMQSCTCAYTLLLTCLIDFIKLVTYVAFFFIVVNFYALPLHIIRDLFATFKYHDEICSLFALSRCHPDHLPSARQTWSGQGKRLPSSTGWCLALHLQGAAAHLLSFPL